MTDHIRDGILKYVRWLNEITSPNHAVYYLEEIDSLVGEMGFAHAYSFSGNLDDFREVQDFFEHVTAQLNASRWEKFPPIVAGINELKDFLEVRVVELRAATQEAFAIKAHVDQVF